MKVYAGKKGTFPLIHKLGSRSTLIGHAATAICPGARDQCQYLLDWRVSVGSRAGLAALEKRTFPYPSRDTIPALSRARNSVNSSPLPSRLWTVTDAFCEIHKYKVHVVGPLDLGKKKNWKWLLHDSSGWVQCSCGSDIMPYGSFP